MRDGRRQRADGPEAARPLPFCRLPSYFFSVIFVVPETVVPPLRVYESLTVSFTLFGFLSAFTPAFVNFSVPVPWPEAAVVPLPAPTAFEPFRPLSVRLPAPGPTNLTFTPLFRAFFSDVFVKATESCVTGVEVWPSFPPGGGVLVVPLLLTVL